MKAVTFSFDDGVIQDARMIGLMKKYGLKGTFNLNSGLFGKRFVFGPELNNAVHQRVTESEAKELYKEVEVAAHTRTHPDLKALAKKEIVEEVVYDYMRLSELMGKEVVGMAYPGGPPNYNEFVRETIRENTSVRYARRYVSSYSFAPPEDFLAWQPTSHLLDERMDSLIDEFFARGEDGIFYIWGHTYELDIHSAWDRAEKLFERLGGRADIRYMTNGEIYRSLCGE